MKLDGERENQRLPQMLLYQWRRNPVLVDSIKAGISKLKLVNLRDALKVRGLKTLVQKKNFKYVRLLDRLGRCTQ
jgi:hypothetical protein